MKDYTISEVNAHPNEHKDGHYEWEAIHTPKENVEDVVVERKTVFAVGFPQSIPPTSVQLSNHRTRFC